MQQLIHHSRRRWLGLLLLILLLAPLAASRAGAQPGDDPWSAPVNLSRSGAATDPLAVVDAAGALHVLWREDAINRFVYTRGQNGEWTRPLPVETPFATKRYLTEEELRSDPPTPLYTPLLVADRSGRIHAFWRDDENVFYYSQVPAAEFGNFAAWTPRQEMAEAATAWTAVVDNTDTLHLAYVRPLDTDAAPAGVYYQRTAVATPSWSGPRNLYGSAYFRALPPEEANLQLAATDDGGVWAGWDLPPLEQVYVIGSRDRGETWGDLTRVDRRREEDSFSAVGPSQLRLAAGANTLHVLWQAGHDGAACNLYHQWTADGATWSERRALEDLGCPEMTQWLSLDGQLLLLTAGAGGGVGLTVWDGARWSETQAQPGVLVSFTDPDTFRTVEVGCRQAAVAGRRLSLVGCDAGETGEDVWLQERTLGDLSAWFAPPPRWSAAAPLAATGGAVSSLTALADAARVHAFWTQSDSAAVLYARYESDRWSSPAPVLTSPEGRATQPAVTLSAADRLLATWTDSRSGLLYFSQADAARAASAAEWSEPLPLPLPRPGAGASDVLDNRAGRFTVAYALPINEGRGIYVTHATDEGETWSEPLLAVDATAADWPLVDHPRLAVTLYDRLHLLFRRGAFDSDAQALYYVRSKDGGQTWSDPEQVQTGTGQEGSVIWHAIVGIGERVVHRVWQTQESGRTTLWHQVSVDDGLTWSRAATVSGGLAAGAAGGPAALTVDANGRLHLLQTVGATLQNWTWDGERWVADDESVALDEETTTTALAAALSPDGPLTAVFAARPVAGAADTLFYTRGAVEPLTEPPPPLPTLTPTPPPTPAPTATPLPQPTPTVAFPVDRDGGPASQLGLPGSVATPFQIALGVLPALLIVAISFAVGVRIVRKR